MLMSAVVTSHTSSRNSLPFFGAKSMPTEVVGRDSAEIVAVGQLRRATKGGTCEILNRCYFVHTHLHPYS